MWKAREKCYEAINLCALGTYSGRFLHFIRMFQPLSARADKEMVFNSGLEHWNKTSEDWVIKPQPSLMKGKK